MSISMAILAMTMVSFIMLYVGTQALNSMYVARKKSDNSVGMAAGDSAIEKLRVALQAGLANEVTDYELTKPALDRLVSRQPGASVIPNDSAPGYAAMAPVRLADARLHYTVREQGTDTVGYWQVFDIIRPRYHRSAPNDVVYYIRAWATGRTSTNITTKPRIFRVEFRPGWFSDYQSVTDAPFFIKDNQNVTVDGPIHSNGYEVVNWLALDDSGASRRGIYFKDAPTCTARAQFTTSQDQGISVPGGSCADARDAGRRDARQISLLGVQDTYEKIRAYCPGGGGLVFCRNDAATYDVRLGNQSVRVNNTTYGLRNRDDSGSLVLLLDGDVILRGALTMPANRAGRVTIAVRRRTVTDRQPQVHLRGCEGCVVGAATPGKDTVAVITQGDVILDTRNYGGGCLSRVNLAAISQAGAVTVPPEFVTLAPPAYDLDNLDCPGETRFRGSFSAHGQFVPSIKWPDIRTGGWTGTVGYSRPVFSYNRNLFTNPPPFFPLATPWGVTKAKDANDRCLVPPNAGDPTCE